MKNVITKSGLLLSASLLSFVTIQANAAGKTSIATAGTEVSVMAWNAENFFDDVQDNKYDITFLPLAMKNNPEHQKECAKITVNIFRDECNFLDWNDQVVATKLKRVADVIASIDHGNGPDILILEEIENISVLTRLMAEVNKRLPADKAYLEPILLEGWDTRGIDVGMLSRFKLAKPTTITPVTMNGKILDSRGILHSVFVLPDGANLNVFGVHFPSGGNPTVMREAAVDSLNTELAKVPASELSIAGGDFNINSQEESQYKLFAEKLGNNWLVSHLIGCKHCVGTEYYGKDSQWSFLDALLFTKNMSPNSQGWVVDEQSIDVPNTGPEQTWNGKPNRFSPDHGVSDHWPVFARIRKN